VLVKIDNPETLAKNEQAAAANVVAGAQLANINAGTRAEVIAARKAALERAEASVVLARKNYDRTSQLAASGNAPQARLDQMTDTLHESQRAVDQAKSAYEQVVNGYTREEHEIAEANVGKAVADIKAVQSIIDQMVVYAPVASQVYQRNVEPGEYVAPGVPLVTLIDLNDLWVHFDLREDLVRMLKLGDRFDVRIPALADRRVRWNADHRQRFAAVNRRVRKPSATCSKATPSTFRSTPTRRTCSFSERRRAGSLLRSVRFLPSSRPAAPAPMEVSSRRRSRRRAPLMSCCSRSSTPSAATQATSCRPHSC
jgi:multidrug resistance efflux pump